MKAGCRTRCRDFIVTNDNLVFAVTEYLHPADRVIGFLRFIPSASGYEKVADTGYSYSYLEKHKPEYLFESDIADTILQAVPIKNIEKQIKPDEYLRELKPTDSFKRRVLELTELISEHSEVPLEKLGVTGSVLVGAHTLESDIDLVVYGKDNFDRVRGSLAKLKEEGAVGELSIKQWRQWYEKRLPGRELSFDEFMWHGRRKNNSGVFDGRKFDVLYTRDWDEIRGAYGRGKYKKLGTTKILAEVTDDTQAFDYPAKYRVKTLEGKKVREIVSYTHTYTGQAQKGETVEAQGILEEATTKEKKWLRLLVGSTREAEGEYIKVV